MTSISVDSILLKCYISKCFAQNLTKCSCSSMEIFLLIQIRFYLIYLDCC